MGFSLVVYEKNSEVEKMEIYFQSDQGKKRNSNQDYVATFKNQKQYTLALLADGMGGHQAGDIASRQAVEEIGQKWQQTSIDESEKAAQWFIQQIQKENQIIYEKGQTDLKLSGMGTTFEAVAVFDHHLALAHVGDSRIYIVRDHQLLPLTEDHSLVNELVKSGEITKEMAAVHPRKNIITRSIGMPGTIEVDVATYPYRFGDFILICSDGLTNMVSEAKMLELIQTRKNLKALGQALIDEANQQGGLDNITVLLIDFGGKNHD